MPAFLDPVTFIVRAGPEAYHFGRPYRTTFSLTVQHDRSIYASAIASEKLSHRDTSDSIEAIRVMAPLFGWTELLWGRERTDGTCHLARIPIVAPRRGPLITVAPAMPPLVAGFFPDS